MTEKGERIAKVIARAGICSRRQAEVLILEGKVSLNGKIQTSPALNVTDKDQIVINGKPLPQKEITRLWKYYKPTGLICSNRDPEGRKTIFEDLKEKHPALPHVISIGRLDFNSEGLLLLTNDGNLARYLELPSTGWVRRYKVRVFGTPDPTVLKNLEQGITIEGIHYGSILATLESTKGSNSWLIIKIKEGKNQEIRRVMKHLGYTVNRLIRLSYGPFQLGSLDLHGLEEVSQKVLKEQVPLTLAPLPK